MRVIGYCEKCRRIRPVNASSVGVARVMLRSGAVVGICAACQEEEDKKR